MYLQNLHTHSTFCDGKNTLEEMCQRAVELGYNSIGFSRHACMPHASIYCKGGEAIVEYHKRSAELKKQYEGKLDIFCGAEFDLYSIDPHDGYDYIIGSFHYLKEDGKLVGIDRTPEQVQAEKNRLIELLAAQGRLRDEKKPTKEKLGEKTSGAPEKKMVKKRKMKRTGTR